MTHVVIYGDDPMLTPIPDGYRLPYPEGGLQEAVPADAAPASMRPVAQSDVPLVAAGATPPGWNRPPTADEMRGPPRRREADMARGASYGQIGIRAANVVGGEPQFINPPKYPINCDGTIDTPLDLVQPQFVGVARQTWQTVLTVALPYARVHGMPGEAEIIPGLSGPLNADERVALQELLDEV